MKNNSRIYVEIAARASVEQPTESFCGALGVDTHQWRFDTRNIVGDFIIVEMPMAISTEGGARLALFTELMKTFKG